MKNIVRIIEENPESFLDELARRKADDLDRVLPSVAEILRQVREEGDRALVELTRRFDGVSLNPKAFRIGQVEIDQAFSRVEPELVAALKAAYERICDYHRKQLENSWFSSGPDGEILGQRILPVESAAIYAPGGKAAYPSSVLMGVGAARSAGVQRVALFSPPGRESALNPAVLAAAQIAGATEIYRLGGAQAIAAAAYGTESVAPVQVIAGPGNIYVTAAKKLVFGAVNIDMLAGPSEIVVVADDSADPAWVAADLLSQAEHDERAGVLLITVSRKLAENVRRELTAQLERLPKKEIAACSLRDYGAILLAGSPDQALELANRFAPEHLELLLKDPWASLGKIRNAGAVFLGPLTPEALGDYWAGPNHVLPTGGSARCFSPLGVQVFLKRSSLLSFNNEAFERASGPVIRMARAEGLEAHARSIEIRKPKPQ